MIWCDSLSAVSVFAVLLSIHFGSWESVYLVAFISAILSQFSQPSSMRLFKFHVPEEQLQQGMALFQSLMAIFMVLGPMLGTFVYSTFGLEISIAVMGVAFLLSALVLIRLPEDHMEAGTVAAKGQFRKDFTEGFRYVWQSQVLRMLGLAFVLAGLAVGAAQALNLFIVTERLGRSKEFLQYMLMVNGAAMLIGEGSWPPSPKSSASAAARHGDAGRCRMYDHCRVLDKYSAHADHPVPERADVPLYSYRDQYDDSEMV